MVATEEMTDLKTFCKTPPKGWQITYLDETTSTNAIGLEQGAQGALPYTVIVADHQTEGRGRLGKHWQSYGGCGLYLSMILRPKLGLQELSHLTLAAGVALAETVRFFTKIKPMLKWPNDLILSDLKCAGILAESNLRHGASPLVVLGIGVNIDAPDGGYDPDLRVRAGSINDFCDGCSRTAFLQRLIPALKDVVLELEDGHFQTILKRWRTYDYTKGKCLTWVTAGGDIVEGVCAGINNDGLLYITDTRGITHEVLSGDVQLAK
jgi:BirA family biotin operon repressor/biotin-[acetyl-CoA-carboxylase] ligase